MTPAVRQLILSGTAYSSRERAAVAAARAAGGFFFYPKRTLSNVFTDASGLVPAAAGDSVRYARDDVSGLFATQGTAGSRPTLRMNALGIPYLEFDGTSDWMGATLTQPTGDFTIIFAASVGAISGQRDFCAGGLNSVQLYKTNATNFLQDKPGVGASISGTVGAATKVYSATRSGTTRRLFADGVQVATDTSAVNYTGSGDTGIGANGDGSGAWMPMSCYAWFFSTVALSDSDRGAIERFGAFLVP